MRAKDQVWCELAQEAVILNFKSGVYFGLNPVAARVWSLIQEPRTVSALLASALPTAIPRNLWVTRVGILAPGLAVFERW